MNIVCVYLGQCREALILTCLVLDKDSSVFYRRDIQRLAVVQ